MLNSLDLVCGPQGDSVGAYISYEEQCV